MRRIQPLDAGPAAAAVGVPIPKQRHHHQQQQQQHPTPASASSSATTAPKSLLKRLLERQFPALHRTSSSERLAAPGDNHHHRAADPGSLCLEKMVHNFLEGESSGGEEGRPHAAPAAATHSSASMCGRSRCNCFHSNCVWEEGSPEDELFGSPPVQSPRPPPPVDASLVIKNLLLHTTPLEKALATDVALILEKPKPKLSSSSSSSSALSPAGPAAGGGTFRSKTRRLAALVDGLISLGHDASICRSRWARAPNLAPGEHEYADVLFACGERLVVDLDFRSEFQVARPTTDYRSALALLPAAFVGAPERLREVVAVAAGAARRSLKKKGLHVPPWRTEQYMLAKWLSPGHERVPNSAAIAAAAVAAPPATPFVTVPVVAGAGCWGAVATASVVVHRTRPARVAPGVADWGAARGVKPVPARSRQKQPPQPAAVQRVGWAVPGPDCVI